MERTFIYSHSHMLPFHCAASATTASAVAAATPPPRVRPRSSLSGAAPRTPAPSSGRDLYHAPVRSPQGRATSGRCRRRRGGRCPRCPGKERWYRPQDTSEDKDQHKFTTQLLYYLGAFAGGILFFVLRDYARETLSLRWRSWMTSYYMKRYFKNRTFYKIQSQSIIDNPDQRINDDLSVFTGTALAFSLTLFNAAVDLGRV